MSGPQPGGRGTLTVNAAGRAASSVARFREAAALSDACERLSPYERERFTLSFTGFDEYAAWKDAQVNPWHR